MPPLKEPSLSTVRGDATNGRRTARVEVLIIKGMPCDLRVLFESLAVRKPATDLSL
jgi:hypothetical protein